MLFNMNQHPKNSVTDFGIAQLDIKKIHSIAIQKDFFISIIRIRELTTHEGTPDT